MTGLAASTVTLVDATLFAVALAVGGAIALSRDGRSRRGVRIVALVVALVGLLGLVLRPLRSAAPGAGRATVVETAGAGAREDGLRWREGDTWQVAADARTLWRNRPDLQAIEVQGYGLDADGFRGYRGAITRFEPPPLAPGIVSAVWARTLPLGSPWTVDTRAIVPVGGLLQLAGPGGVEAEADAATAARGVSLTTIPRAPGRFLFSLSVRDAARTEVARELLDLTVETPSPAKALVLFGAPSFDAQALLRWLRAAQVPFEARLEVSRDRSHVEAFWPTSGAPPPPVLLNPKALAAFDVVVIDGRSLAALPPHERTVLDAAIEQGLGLLVVEAEPGEERGLGLGSQSSRGAPERQAPLHWPGQAHVPSLTTANREVIAQADVAGWIDDGSGHALVARRRRGQGFVALSLLTGTYRLALESATGDYGALWARLLSAVARPRGGEWLVAPSGPVVADHPFDVTLQLPSARRPRFMATDEAESVELPVGATGRGWFASRVWPRRAGWLHLTTDGGSSSWIYVSAQEGWQRARQAARIEATREQAARPGRPAEQADRPLAPGPRWPWYALFLTGVGLLWLIERVGGEARLELAPPAQLI